MARNIRYQGRHEAADSRGRAMRVQGRTRRRRSIVPVVLLSLLMLLLGFVAGVFVSPLIPLPGKPAPQPSMPGLTSVSEADLDARIGSYRMGDTNTDVTVREAILETRSLDAARRDDGTYDVPSADAVLAVARNRVLADEAVRKGIQVTDAEVASYAREFMGTDDFKEIAEAYAMDEAQAREAMARSASIRALRDAVVGTPQAQEPEPPVAPEVEGAEDVMLPEYGAYVTNLCAAEWDVAGNMWVEGDGPFRQGLTDYTITNDGATYSAACAAYEIACKVAAEQNSSSAQEWTHYVNTLLSEVTVELETLVV